MKNGVYKSNVIFTQQLNKNLWGFLVARKAFNVQMFVLIFGDMIDLHEWNQNQLDSLTQVKIFQ